MVNNLANAAAERVVDELKRQGIDIDIDQVTNKRGAIDKKKLKEIMAMLSQEVTAGARSGRPTA